MIDGFSLD